MVSMKAVDYIKTESLVRKIVAICAFLFNGVGSLGFLIYYCMWTDKWDEFPREFRNDSFKKIFGVLGTALALAIATVACYGVWIILFNFDILTLFQGLIFYGALGVSIALLVFGLTLAIMVKSKPKNDLSTCQKAGFVYIHDWCQNTFPQSLSFFIILLIGDVLAVALKFFL